MNKGDLPKIWISLMMLVILFILAFMPLSLITKVILFVMIILLFFLFILAEHRKQEVISRFQIEENQNINDDRLIQAFHHQRHDWLNDIQVLYGYISLKKFDKISPYLDKIKNKMHHESSISKLGVSSLSVLLLTFSTDCPNIDLTIELEKELNMHHFFRDASTVALFFEEMLYNFKHCLKENGDSHPLHVKFFIEENEFVVNFSFQGNYNMAYLDVQLEETIKRYKKYFSAKEESDLQIEQASITVRVPIDAH